jgi:NAD(P)H-flavin reductase
MSRNNIYIPVETKIQEVTPLTPDVRLYTLEVDRPFQYKAGQFFMVSVFGFGEVPISVTSTMDEPLKLCIRKTGHVTSAIHNLRAGDTLGVRGPYGNGFSIESAKAGDVIVMAGGLGIVPLRPLIREIVKKREDYGKVFVLYGSKTPADIVYKEELDLWAKSGVEVSLTVDCKDEKWAGCIGVVTALLDNVKTDFSQACAYICGPEIMIEESMKELSLRGMPDEKIITSLEAHMKCGVGKCGHCYKGPKFVCTDGPVFSLKELRTISVL